MCCLNINSIQKVQGQLLNAQTHKIPALIREVMKYGIPFEIMCEEL